MRLVRFVCRTTDSVEKVHIKEQHNYCSYYNYSSYYSHTATSKKSINSFEFNISNRVFFQTTFLKKLLQAPKSIIDQAKPRVAEEFGCMQTTITTIINTPTN